MQSVTADCAVRRSGARPRAAGRRSGARGAYAGAGCGLLVTLALWIGAPLDARAGLQVDVHPPPPAELPNPGGSLEVEWLAQFEDPPDRIEYILLDPTRTIVIERETYDASEGVARTRLWSVPEGMGGGKYWVRVEYWSRASGLIATADAAFLIAPAGGPAALDPPLDPVPPGEPAVPSSWGRIKARPRESTAAR